MADPDRGAIGPHVTSIAARTVEESDALLGAVRAHCWPSGSNDRANAYALEWVRRWHPVQGMIPTVTCGCARGICSVCN